MTEAIAKPSPQLGKLLMLASSNLPIGSYTYSQGLESAIEAGDVFDEASTQAWITDYLYFTLLQNELPIMAVMLTLLTVDNEFSDPARQLAMTVGNYHLASRETAEFERESEQMAHAFVAWIESVLSLNVPDDLHHQGYLPLFTQIAQHQGLSHTDILLAYGFGQLENLVLAGVKTVPLGQMAGQRILWQLQNELEQELGTVLKLTTEYVGNLFETWRNDDAKTLTTPEFDDVQLQLDALMLVSNVCTASNLPNLAMLSCEHERQYSRLYRS